MKKLKEILLIDDSRGANNLNKLLLLEIGITEKVTSMLNGSLALDYLSTKNEAGNYPSPCLILLDINMPVMDGYQFLEAYEKVSIEMKLKSNIVMLTTSIYEVDVKTTQSYSNVKGYLFKPLEENKLIELLENIF